MHKNLGTILIAVAILGCASGPMAGPERGAGTWADGVVESMSKSTDAMRHSWSRISGSKKVVPRGWEWVAAIPADAPRAELVATTVPVPAVAALLPNEERFAISLVSSDHAARCLQITEVASVPTHDFASLHATVTRAVDSERPVEVLLVNPASQPATSIDPVKVDSATLLALSHAVASDLQAIRVNEGGNPWLLIRDGGARCKLMARVERKNGLLHLVVSLANCWGPQILLPADLRVDCEGEPLRCLSVTETLELLYGDSRRIEPPSETSQSFAAVSEREDYLMPTNYRRLQELQQETRRSSVTPPALPAFATIAGVTYPGPAELGDARALSAFALQRQLYTAGEPERVGWIVFAGESLGDGQSVEVVIDLGNGEQRFTLSIPKS